VKLRPESRLERVAWVLLCALVFSLPLEKGVFIPGFGTISRAVGLAAFLAGAAAVAPRRRMRPPNAALLFAAAFVLWSGITWRWSMAPPATAARFVTLAQLFAMVWLIFELCRTGAAQIQLLQAYVAGAAASSVWTIVRAAANEQTNWRRFATAGFDPNDLGITLALALTMTLYLGTQTRGWSAALVWVAGAMADVGILLTASRTALLAALVGVVFILLTWRRSRVSQRLCQIGLLLLLVLGAARLAPSSSRERLATLPKEVASGTFHNRTRIWKAGLRLFRHSPIKGVGAAA
jgi:O-antigen ligase